jgi:hypothetical protein
VHPAVVPIACFTSEHVEMTARFLAALRDEPGVGQALIYWNGGLPEGREVIESFPVEVHDAEGWPFYRMWNRGIREAKRYGPVALILNNDIEWERGALCSLAAALSEAPPRIGVTFPDWQGIGGFGLTEVSHQNHHSGWSPWCFAVRSDVFEYIPEIDESYVTWYGDDELLLNLEQAGRGAARVGGVTVRHPRPQATTDHLPDVAKIRWRDRERFVARWGWKE